MFNAVVSVVFGAYHDEK